MRIYFDWNVLTQLKNPQSEPFISLAPKVGALKKYVLMPYSPSHISDLMKGWDDSELKNEFIQKDLQFISDFTQDQLLVQYWNDEWVKPVIRSPHDYFESAKEDYGKPMADMMDLRNLFKDFDPHLQEQVNPKLQELETTMMPFSKDMAKTFRDNGIDFPIPDKPISILDWISQFGAYFDKLNQDPEHYKALRMFLTQGLQLEPRRISNLGTNAIEELDKILPATHLGKSFSQHVIDGNSSGRTKNSDYDRFMMKYTQLDMFGFHPEKITPKNTYENMTNDSLHAFYAAHCDIFVTADKHSIPKTKAVYADEKIDVKVLSPQEFLEQIDSIIPKVESLFGEFIVNLMGAAVDAGNAGKRKLLPSGTMQFYMEPTTIHSFGQLDYFEYSEDKNGYAFKMAPRNYSKFHSYKQIQFLVNHLADMLGSDYNGLSSLDWEQELPLMQNGNWGGRIWKVNEAVLMIIQDTQFEMVYITLKPVKTTT